MAFSARFLFEKLKVYEKNHYNKILFQSQTVQTTVAVGHVGWSDQSVLALCALYTSDDSKTSGTYFICQSKRKDYHAEDCFITNAREILEKKWKGDGNMRKQMVTMVMMITKTPCENCQTALKDFLDETQKGKAGDVQLGGTVRVNFVLRVSNPYLGGRGESKKAPEVIWELLEWKSSFKFVNITIEPMLITEELTRYDEPIDYTEQDRKMRQVKDYKIQYLMEVGRKRHRPILINLQIDSKLKRLLYQSPSDGSRATIVVPLKPDSELTTQKENCCEALRSIIEQQTVTTFFIYTQNISCDECLKKIQAQVMKCHIRGLIIKVANISDNDKDRIFEWIKSTRDRRPAFTLQLKPFFVVWELFNTNTPGPQLDWPEIVMRRIRMDFAVYKKVEEINARLAVNTVSSEISQMKL